MKKQLTSPCNGCNRLKRFFCLISCNDYDQWNMDQYIMPMFKAPKPVEQYTELDSKDELIDAMSEKIYAQDQCIASLKEDVNLYKAAEQFNRQELMMHQVTLKDRDNEINDLKKALFDMQPFKDNYEEMGIGTVHVEICDYCKEKHDPRVACTEYAATLKGIDKVPPGEPDPRD